MQDEFLNLCSLKMLSFYACFKIVEYQGSTLTGPMVDLIKDGDLFAALNRERGMLGFLPK